MTVESLHAFALQLIYPCYGLRIFSTKGWSTEFSSTEFSNSHLYVLSTYVIVLGFFMAVKSLHVFALQSISPCYRLRAFEYRVSNSGQRPWARSGHWTGPSIEFRIVV